jgi:uncharacterized membrane protein
MRTPTGAAAVPAMVGMAEVKMAAANSLIRMNRWDAHRVPPPSYLYNPVVQTAAPSTRRVYVDWARGVAVLLMIEAHTIDAWTRLRDKQLLAYEYGTVLGGFAAPMFLWLAGLGVAMSMARTYARTGSRQAALHAATIRGAEIFLLAFLFRLQAFIVSPGSHPVTLFRVDVLNVMGPAMVATGLLWAAASHRWTRVATFAIVAFLIALVTPIVRASASVDLLPLWFQWYVRPAGEFTTFTMLPWSGFVFAGAAVGVLIASTTDARRLHAALAVVGVLMIAGGLHAASRPSIYTVPANFWTSSPTFFAVRVGILTVVLAALSFVPPFAALEPLAVLGRASLFVYWIHVELVYGYASWLWRHRLPLWAWPIGYLGFTVLIYRAIGLRDRFLANRRGRGSIPAPLSVSQA